MSQGYFRQPTVAGDQIVFVSEDDLWSVPLDGGIARRLTSGRGNASWPSLSPDGSMLAFTSTEEGQSEVWVMSSDGGPATRLTFLGAGSGVRGWTADGRIVFASDTAQPFGGRVTELHAVSPDGGPVARLPFGPAATVAFGPEGAVVIGRNTADPARWKRYRGGTAGKLWIDAKGSGEFSRILRELDTNLGSPMWIAGRVYCISDHEGVGNVYSVAPDGSDIRSHTRHRDFYARYPSTDGTNIVYHAGAELYRLDPAGHNPERIDVEYHSPRVQRNRRFVDAAGSLQGFTIHPAGHSVAIEARGRAFTMPFWEGAPRQWGERDGVRYRLGQWLHDGETFIAVSDESGDEGLDVFAKDGTRQHRVEAAELGRPISMNPSPIANLVVVTNHRGDVLLVDVDKQRLSVLDHSDHQRIERVEWSPDGRWIAYGFSTQARTALIRVTEVKTGTTHDVTRPDFRDYEPSWDPDGKFLAFLSAREFNPVYDSHFFDLGFPKGSRPMLLTLGKDTRSPFIQAPRALDSKPGDDATKATDKDDDTTTADAAKGAKQNNEKGTDAKDEPTPVEIDFDGIADRVLAVPVPEGIYAQLRAVSGRILFTASDVAGSLGRDWSSDGGPSGRLEYFAFDDQKHDTLVSGVDSFEVNAKHKTVVYSSGGKLRAIAADAKPDDNAGPGRASGWLELSRLRISLLPTAEWEQMLREAWRLQRDHFWTADISGIDWPAVLTRYLPLLEKVAARTEFSDLMWELQGELGTSHAYEMGGDHRRSPKYQIGLLGADLTCDPETGRTAITRIPRGDSWDDAGRSPLAGVGLGISEGDTILAIGGQRVDAQTSLGELLVNQARTTIELTVGDSKGENPRDVPVTTLASETQLRYRDWVEANRATVHEASAGRLGYVHVPDMGPRGYSEFHRYLSSELEHDGLVVDVRYNGGGHVSQLLLEKLMRTRLAYTIKRYGTPEPYPTDTVLGPIVALTNESAGSDGDIFSHSFKQLGIGPLVGTRTWGGVVGIWPRHSLADGSVTTQPEYAFWFTDVGWGVENFGTEPTHEVEITPQQYVAGEDPQLDTAIRLALEAMERSPAVIPDFAERPNLAAPELA